MNYFIIIRGPLGSGKTTVSTTLAKRLNADHVGVDQVVDTIPKEQEGGMISQKTFIKANQIITEKSRVILDKGKPVIFDGNFYWKSQIEDLISRLKDYKHFVFTLKAPLKICVDRDRKREVSYGKDAAEAVYNKTTEFDYGIIIDATKPLDDCINKILSYGL